MFNFKVLIIYGLMFYVFCGLSYGAHYNSANGHYYDLISLPSNSTWHNCRDSAIALNGYLATITSQQEQDFIYSFLVEGDAGFLGGTDEAIEGTWVWANGEAWGYTNWRPGEPNSGGNSGDEDYITMDSDYGGGWNDLWAHFNGFFIEWDRNPDSNIVLNVPSEYPTIQSGIDAAWDGDTVLVADGIYTGEGNRNISYLGKAIVVRSENGPDLTIIDCQGTMSVPYRGFIFQNSMDTTSKLIGISIKGGYGLYDYPDDASPCGGGILCENGASPMIINCFFKSNHANKGGAIACHNSQPIIKDCVFDSNFVDYYGTTWGGAIFTKSGGTLVENCDFLYNYGDRGSAICFTYGTPTARNCDFRNNYYSYSGDGVIYIRATSLIEDCNIIDNVGHGLHLIEYQPTISNCTIASNTSYGIYCYQTNATLNNCIIAYNGNRAAVAGNLIFNCSDIYGNIGGDWIESIADQYGINGNISADPLFCDVSIGNYSINAISPCAPNNNECNELIGAINVGCGYVGPVWHVSVEGNDITGIGSIDLPFATIQKGIDMAQDGDTVLIADGIYSGDGNRNITANGKAIVIKSANGPGNCIIDLISTDYNGFNFAGNSEDTLTVIKGLKIANGDYAIFLESSSPKLENLILENCNWGIHPWASSSYPIIRNCRFYNCLYGLRIGANNINILIDSCTFIDNRGTGVTIERYPYEYDSTIHINNCIFQNNNSGIWLYYYYNQSTLKIDNCLFLSNDYAIWGDFTMSNCTIMDGINGIGAGNGSKNDLQSKGEIYGQTISHCRFYNLSGVVITPSVHTKLFNCIIGNNQGQIASGQGLDGGSPKITFDSCQIFNNGGGIFVNGWGSWIKLNNCMYYKNTGSILLGQQGHFGSLELIQSTFVGNHDWSIISLSNAVINNTVIAFNNGVGLTASEYDSNYMVNCSNVYGNSEGDYSGGVSEFININGNISLDPMFCDTTNEDLTIKDISPCAAENNSCGTLIGALGVGCIDERPEISSLSGLAVFEDSTLNHTAEFTDSDGPDTVVTFINIPSWLNVAGWGVSGVPTEGMGDTSFALIVSDGYKADTQIVTIDVVPVNDAPVLAEMQDQVYYEGSHYELPVNAFDIDGPVLELTTSDLPANATFYDSTNGAGLFTFDPDIDQAGVVSVFFFASDGEYADSQRVKFTVLESDIQIASLKIDNFVNPQHLTNHTPLVTWSYTDPLDLKAQSQCEIEVGEDDNWELAELWNPDIFSSTDTFVVYAGAPLFDGATYYVRLRLYNNSVWSHWIEANFRMNSVPNVPTLSWPQYNAVIDDNQPVVYVHNASDAENDSLEYDYEVFTDSSYGNIELHMGFYVEEQDDSTGWLVDAILYENWKYWWRARSYDGFERSNWTAIAPFWINVNEESPETFLLISPDTSLGIVYDMLPEIAWTASDDADPLDSVYYRVTVAVDDDFMFKCDIDSIWNMPYALTDSLAFGTQYWWKVRAIDNTGLYANSGNVMTFKTWKLGDATGDWQVNLLDILYLIDDLYGSGEPPTPAYTGDVNGDCAENLLDILYLIAYIYNFPPGPAPVVGCE